MAADGETVFGCQWEGNSADTPPLVGVLSRAGVTRFLDTPEDDLASLDNYVGSVALDAGERVIAATSPRGGTVAFWDRASGRYKGRRRIPDACGVAPAAQGAGLFVVSSGNAGVSLAAADRQDVKRLGGTDLGRWAWDNHILSL